MILVTGATGFLGSYFVQALLDRGERVRALYRDSTKITLTHSLLKAYGQMPEEEEAPQLEWFEADILDIAALEEAFQGVDTVIHCAALVSFHRQDRERLHKVNIEGTANVVQLSLKHRVNNLCHISSIAALGYVEPPGRIREDSPWNREHSSGYGWSKREAELEVWRGIQEGLSALIVNPGVILGPGDWPDGSPSLYRRVKKGLRRYPPSGVAAIAVQEVVGLSLALLDAGVRQKSFILVQEEITNKRLLEIFLKAAGKRTSVRPISLTTLTLFYHLESALTLLAGRRPRLSRDLLRAFAQSAHYDNSKVLSALDYTYPDLEEQLVYAFRQYEEGVSQAGRRK